MQNAKQAHRNILFSTTLIIFTVILAGIAGNLLLAYYNHRDFHHSMVQTIESRTEGFEEVVTARLLASANIFDAIDKQTIIRAWIRGDGAAVQDELRKVYSSATQEDIVSMTIIGKDERFFASIGDAPRARLESVPLTNSEHTWLYWNNGWWLEHHVDVVVNGLTVGEWIAQIRMSGFHGGLKPSLPFFIPGAMLSVCALKDGDYPCLSMPNQGEPPAFYQGENMLCLTPGCKGGGREEEFTKTHGLVAGYQTVEGFDVMMVYTVPLENFFLKEQWYERITIIAILSVALTGLWLVYRQARPLARRLVRTTVHMQEIMSKLPESIITVNRAGEIRMANPATRRTFGYPSEALIGKSVELLMPPPPGESAGAVIEEFFLHPSNRESLGEPPLPRELEARHKDGTAIPIELLTGEYRFENESYFIGIARDIRQRKRDEESLRRWAQIFEHAEWGIVVTSGPDNRLEMMNPAFARMHGYKVDELIGRPAASLLAPECQTSMAQHIQLADENGGHYSWEMSHYRRDGSWFIGLNDIINIKDAAGHVRFRVMNIRDITARKRDEETLRRNEARLANAQRIARLGDWEWDIGKNSLKWSEETWRLLGLRPEQCEPTSEVFISAVDPADRRLVRDAVATALSERRPYSIDYRVRRAGVIRVIHEEGEVVCAEEGRPIRMVGTLQDVTELKQRELELERQRAQLQELAANRETVREQERTRIAREIHDELGQSLTTLRMKAALLGLELGRSEPALVPQIDQIKSLVDQNIVVARNVAAKLRPGALDLGIVSAIEWLAQDFEERTGILCGLDIDSRLHDVELDDERATMVFRILQESLTNVVRHAQASHVEIGFEERDGSYWLEVEDDGLGFDPHSQGERKTFGLLGIRERATVLGGEVLIDSAPGAGTRVELRIPIAETGVTTGDQYTHC